MNYDPKLINPHINTREFNSETKRNNLLFKTVPLWSDKYFPEKKYKAKIYKK